MKRAKKKALKSSGLIVLCFHNPRKGLFEKIISWLQRNGFNIISPNEAAGYFTEHKPLPAGAVLITLDDGWQDNLDNVLPVLEMKKVHAAIFACPGIIKSGGVYWWTYAEKYRDILPGKFRADISLLWKVPEAERKKIISVIEEKAGDSLPRQALNIEGLKKISSSEFVTIGSHTVNHAITPNCSDEELENELKESKRMLEEWTGKKVDIFAYPNADHSGREEKILHKSGYILALAGGNRAAGIDDNPYLVPRMVMGEGTFLEELLHIFGVWQKFMGKIK